jgi:site-specific recombinase
VEHKNSRAEKLEEQVLALIKEKYGEVEPEQKDRASIKDLEKQIARLEAKKTSDFEKYKLGKITKLKIIESKKSIDKELESLLERIEELSKQDDIVKDTELTRELMEKYIDSVLCEGSIVQKIIWK